MSCSDFSQNYINDVNQVYISGEFNLPGVTGPSTNFNIFHLNYSQDFINLNGFIVSRTLHLVISTDQNLYELFKELIPFAKRIFFIKLLT